MDRHLREYGRMDGSPSQRLQEECWIRVNGRTGRMPAQSKQANGCIAGSERSVSQSGWADGRITGKESTGGRADCHLREYGQTGGSPTERVRTHCRTERVWTHGQTGGSPAQRVGTRSPSSTIHSVKCDKCWRSDEQADRQEERNYILTSTGGRADRHLRD